LSAQKKLSTTNLVFAKAQVKKAIEEALNEIKEAETKGTEIKDFRSF
jgi:hypothetical protein